MFLGSMSMKIFWKTYPKITIHKTSIIEARIVDIKFISITETVCIPLIDVYEIANKIKQAHGGVSVVMGALSPDVRNAQVELFEDGGVDHIVATDLIGLGLNLNIKNIFSGLLIWWNMREEIN